MADDTTKDETIDLESQSLGVQRLMRMQQELGRRHFLGGAAGLTAAAILAACGGTSSTATSAPASAGPTATIVPTRPAVAPAVTSAASSAPASAAAASASTAASTAASAAPVALPADAAAADQQVWVVNTGQEVKVMDFYEAVYARPTIADLFSEPLVRINKEFDIIPGGALSWAGSTDGKTWTFKLDPSLMWSDGNPVTADDYVATFQYAADPKHAWDFTWFFQGVIAGWDDAIGGKIPLDQIGVKKGADANTVVFTTQVPAPYLPAMLLYSWPLSKAALAKSGPLYNTKPETAVSSGPFILKEWAKDQRIVFERNAKYTGKLKPMINRIVQKVAAPTTNFTAYQNSEIDYTEGLAPAEIKLVQDSADLSKEAYSSVGDFRTYYLFFDVTKPPFDNIKVRQAFSHVVDRDQIQKTILGPTGTQAYSWLAPGFPSSNREGLKDIQKYDVALGKQLLAEAGFANGANFPKQVLWLRNETALNQAVANSIASAIKTNLGVDVEVSNKDTKLFMDSLTAKPTQILFGYVSYGMDFLDPFNMLSVWFSGGRHSWANKDFDTKAKEAATFLGPTEQRLKMFQDAEKILVSDVPGIFVYHATPLQLFKPWVKGEALEPDKLGNKSLHWPGYSTATLAPNGFYMTKDVSKRKS